MAEHARGSPGAVAIVDGARSITWSELEQHVRSLEEWLREQEVRPGTRVGVLAWNRVETIALLYAAGRCSAAVVPYNARLTAPELAKLVSLSHPRWIFADESLLAQHPQAQPFPVNRVFTASPGSSSTPPTNAAQDGATPASAQPEIATSLTAAALFTSGTTGTPRLIELSWDNFRASAHASGENLGRHSTQVWLCALPLFHVGGLALVTRCVEYGASLVLEPSFDLSRAARWLRSGEVTHASLVPTALTRLLELPAVRPFSAKLEAVLIGGGPVDPALMRRARAAGLPVLQTYGLTEACSQVATEFPGNADGASAGRPLMGVEVQIVDGEIQVRGPTVHRNQQGWLPTGDLGELDAQGRLVVNARRVDLIVSGGENVYPAEVEQTLAQHPSIADVAVGAEPSAQWGQRPVAVIAERGRVEDDALRAWCRERLATFKVPTRFLRVAAVPRNATGKIDRLALRKLIVP